MTDVAGSTELPTTIEGAAGALRSGELTSSALVAGVLDRIQADDDRIAALLTVFEDSALAAASRADQERAQGIDRGPLHGIPVGVKDIVLAREAGTTGQSTTLAPDWGSGRDAATVRRLRAAGAVVVGKTTTMEFALGVPDPAKPFAAPRNPWDLGRWAGGSSSGSGSGVAAGFFLGAIGTDTSGSIRIPAAFCGITGLKPTYGLVSTDGLIPAGFSLDHVGPMARTALDCSLMMDAWLDGPSLAGRIRTTAETGLRGLRVGVLRDHVHFPEGSHPDIAPAFAAALGVLEGLGAELDETSLPYFREVSAAGRVTLVAEALAYHRAELAAAWEDHFLETRQILASGALVQAIDYVQAQRVRSRARAAVHDLFERYDVLVSPTAVMTAPPVAGLGSAVLQGKVLTRYWDALGNPALAVPMGRGTDGLPLSLQIVAAPHADATALAVGHAFQQATQWHRAVPPSPDTAPHTGGQTDVPAVMPARADDVELARAWCDAAGLQVPESEWGALASQLSSLNELVAILRATDAARDLPTTAPAQRYEP